VVCLLVQQQVQMRPVQSVYDGGSWAAVRPGARLPACIVCCSAAHFLAALFLPLHHVDARHDAHVLHVQLFWSLAHGTVLLCSTAAAGDGGV